MDHNSAAAASVLATFAFAYLVAACTAVAFVAFAIWVYWRIFTKAGYNGALSLLNLIPGVGHLICLLILAFGRWPIEDALATSTPAPPGTSVMPMP
jgi:hypothetical protein